MYNSSKFPNAVWDGLSTNAERASLGDTLAPDGRDWDQLVAEVRATQVTTLAALSDIQSMQSVTDSGVVPHVVYIGDAEHGARILANNGTFTAGVWLWYPDGGFYLDSDAYITFRVDSKHTPREALTIDPDATVHVVGKLVSGGHLISQTATPPTVAPGTGAGTGGGVTVAGTDTAGTVTLTTGSAPATAATVLTLTFGSAFSAAPLAVLLTPANSYAAAAGAYEDKASRSGTGYVVKIGAVALAESTTYIFNYLIIG